MKLLRAFLVIVVGLLLASAPAFAYPNPGTVVGDTMIHDPTMLVRPNDAPRYVVYGTHNQTLVSHDRITFSASGPWFAVKPGWWTEPPFSGDPWAPDVSFHDGKYWLYYAVSKGSGSRTSRIGLATSPTGLPNSWTDQGWIFSSTSSNDYNAIDPNLLVDAEGNWWLTFGSWWSGIWQMRLNPQTGKPTSNPPALTQLAQRARQNPVGPAQPGKGIENAFIFSHGGFYYLFLSYDRCCAAPWDYKIYVGRSAAPNGPYVDKNGRSMINPNYDPGQAPPPDSGTLVLAGHGPYIAPGGQSVVHDDHFGSHDLVVYHYRDNRLMQNPFLGINFLDFSSAWPVVY